MEECWVYLGTGFNRVSWKPDYFIKLIFYIFLNYFNVLMLKIIFLKIKKNIILMHF
jgi:hypothetical protein